VYIDWFEVPCLGPCLALELSVAFHSVQVLASLPAEFPMAGASGTLQQTYCSQVALALPPPSS
jgi:hypothetical protein